MPDDSAGIGEKTTEDMPSRRDDTPSETRVGLESLIGCTPAIKLTTLIFLTWLAEVDKHGEWRALSVCGDGPKSGVCVIGREDALSEMWLKPDWLPEPPAPQDGMEFRQFPKELSPPIWNRYASMAGLAHCRKGLQEGHILLNAQNREVELAVKLFASPGSQPPLRRAFLTIVRDEVREKPCAKENASV